MHSKMMRLGMAVVFVSLVLFAPPAAAFPTYATNISIDGAILTSANPYWKNGGGGSASDWNLFFDTSTTTPVLHMKDAQLTTLYGLSNLLLADGDLVIEISGTNVLSFIGSQNNTVIGLISDGTITIRDGSGTGAGQLNITIDNNVSVDEVTGISAVDGIVMESGSLNVTVSHLTSASTLHSFGNISFRGGQTTLISSAPTASAIDCYMFQLSGGVVQTSVNGFDSGTCALRFETAQLTGGDGQFSVVEMGYGAIWSTPDAGTFTCTGGHVIFSGGDGALSFRTANTLTPVVAGDIFVSEFPSGMDKVRWNPAMDLLATNTSNTSPYGFVEMIAAVRLPQTGDESAPGLWIGIAGLTVLGAAAAYLLIRRKRK